MTDLLHSHTTPLPRRVQTDKDIAAFQCRNIFISQRRMLFRLLLRANSRFIIIVQLSGY